MAPADVATTPAQLVMDMGGLHAAQTEVFDLATLQLRTNAYYYIVRLPALSLTPTRRLILNPSCTCPADPDPFGSCLVAPTPILSLILNHLRSGPERPSSAAQHSLMPRLITFACF